MVERQGGHKATSGKDAEQLTRAVNGDVASGTGGRRSRTPTAATGSLSPSAQTTVPPQLTVAPVPRAGQERTTSLLKVARPMLRTRSTDGATTDSKSINSEFIVAESPSPILTTPAQGLSGLSEALAHLVNEHGGGSRSKVRNGSADEGTNTSSDSHLRPTDEHVKAQAAVLQADVTALIAEASKNGRRLSATMKAGERDGAQQDRSASSSRRPSNAIDRLRLLDAAVDGADSSTSHVASSASAHTKKLTPGYSPNPFSTFSPFQRRGSQEPGAATTMLSSPSMSNAGMSLSSSPHASGKSTPMHSSNSRFKPKVLETSHLHLQTHAASGRRMINQYIIEDELGRGVHGKVRLARDTETGERVAVKIVEREAKKRLGGQNALLGGGRQSDPWKKASGDGGASFENGGEEVSASVVNGPPIVDQTGDDERTAKDGQQKTRFVQPPGSRDGKVTAGIKSEKQREMARKRLLWTTDQKVKREIAIMKKCAHENVVGLKEVIDDPQSKKIFMVLEHMEGGEVQWKDERGFPTLTVDEARRTLRDVVLGLEYLHYQGIIHRDIKPANLLWTMEHRVKISDFGVSHYSYALLVASGGLPSYEDNEEPSLTDDRELAKTAGSPAFFAPELCLAGEPAFSSLGRSSGRGSVKEYKGEVDGEFPWSESNDDRGGSMERKARPPISKAIDIWALGVTLYCLLFGHVPFTADSEFALFNVITREDFEIPQFMGADRIKVGPRKRRWVHQTPWTDEEGDVDEYSSERIVPDADPSSLSEEALLVRDLLDRLLQKDPTKRIKLDEVKKHPWLTRDIADPPQWLNETDPALLPFVQITHEDVETALTGFSKFKQTLKRFQTKLLSTLGGAAHAQGYDRDSRSSSRPGTPGVAPQLTAGPPVRRRRSKSASHASRDMALTAAATAKATTAAPSARTSPINSIYLNEGSGSTATAVPKLTGGAAGSQAAASTLVAKPHLLFSRRRSSALAEQVGASSAGQQVHMHATSVSQPNSRPASPTSGQAPMHSSAVERHHFAHRNIFRRNHHDANAEAAILPTVDATSRPQTGNTSTLSSRSNSSRMRPGSRASLRGAFEALSPMTDASKSRDTIPLTSESASVSRNPSSSMSHAVPTRPRSRSRLAEVFRNVISHHDKQGSKKAGGVDGRSLRFLSRPGTGLNSAAVSPTFERSAGDSMAPMSSPALPAQDKGDSAGAGPTTPSTPSPKSKSVPISPRQGAETALNEVVVATKSGINRPRSTHRKSAGSGGARAIDVDDYDVDFDLSEEDDSDDVHATNGSHALFRATRDGWVPRADRSESGSGAANSKDSSLTPSVEGGYNIFKPAYTGGHFLADDLRSETLKHSPFQPNQEDQFAMNVAHSHDAAALRRAQRADQSHSGRRQKEVTDVRTDAADADLSIMSDDRFADADEETAQNANGAALRPKDVDDPPLNLHRHPFIAMQRGDSVTTSSEISEGASPGTQDDEDFGVSFRAGRRTAGIR